ncbi:MAG: hypothetical protein JWR19_1624 [Pedosphaera sp.]|nr:hypothetical protein [Pedosphaera sp.]
MRLRAKKTERSLRRRIRREITTAESLQWQIMWFHRLRAYPLPKDLYRFVIFLVYPLNAALGSFSLQQAVAIAFLWSAGTTFWRASQLLSALFAAQPLEVFRHLPISDQDIFRHQWRGFLRASLWSMLDFSAVYGVLASKVGFGGWSLLWAGAGMAALQWLVMVSLATALVAYAGRRNYWTIALLLLAGAVGLFIFRGSQPAISEWLTEFARWAPGTGWTLYVFGISPREGLLGEVWPVLTLSIAVFLLPRAYQRLGQKYKLPPIPLTNLPDNVKPSPARVGQLSETEATADPYAALKAAIRRREFLKGYDWQRAGFLERLAFRWLTPQERLTAEFLCAGKPRWTSKLTTLGLGSIVFFALLWLFPAILTVSPFILVYLVTFLFSNMQQWPGAKLVAMGGAGVSLCSAYPLGFKEMTAVFQKTNRLVLLVVPLLAGVAFLFTTFRMNFNSIPVLVISLKVVGIILAFHPAMSILLLSSGTNDAHKPVIIFSLLLGLAVIVPCGITLFFTDSLWLALVLLAVIGLTVHGFFRLYRHGYNHWFDLQGKLKPQSNSAIKEIFSTFRKK